MCCRQITLPYILPWQQAFSWSQNWNLWFKFHLTYGIPIDFKILLDVFWNSLKCYDRERGMAWNLYETVNINFPFVSWRCHWVLMFTALLRQAVESRDQHPFKTLATIKNTVIPFVCLHNFAYALFPVSQEKIKTMLIQTFERTKKEYYGSFDSG